MEAFETCQVAYRLAQHELIAHQRSAFAQEIQSGTMLPALSLYMDLDNWLDNPALESLSEDDKALLREWGESYTKQLSAFHARAETLHAATHERLLRALQALGEQAGREFLKLQGPLERRIATVLTNASQIRQNKLDGIGSVGGVLGTETTRFAQGFYKTSGLNPKELSEGLSEDLKRCYLYRSGVPIPDEKTRLGFADEEVNDEGR
ncbi:hypothetical protein [Azotobacter armeniacus]